MSKTVSVGTQNHITTQYKIVAQKSSHYQSFLFLPVTQAERDKKHITNLK